MQSEVLKLRANLHKKVYKPIVNKDNSEVILNTTKLGVKLVNRTLRQAKCRSPRQAIYNFPIISTKTVML